MGQLQLQTRNTNLHHRTRTTITTVKMGKPSVLVVLTSASEMTGSGKPTGWYLPELAHPYYILKDKVDLTFASPKGGVAPLDQASVEMFKEDEESQRFLKDHKDLWENTKPLSNFKAADFDAIFYPGGHGPVFAHVKLSNGEYMVKGKTVNGFTNTEEEQAGLLDAMPVLLETELQANGAKFVKADPWAPKVAVDGNLISGQNPASAKGVGEAIAKALGV